ncbi:unnamed protein product [Victoria cruziana]
MSINSSSKLQYCASLGVCSMGFNAAVCSEFLSFLKRGLGTLRGGSFLTSAADPRLTQKIYPWLPHAPELSLSSKL